MRLPNKSVCCCSFLSHFKHEIVLMIWSCCICWFFQLFFIFIFIIFIFYMGLSSSFCFIHFLSLIAFWGVGWHWMDLLMQRSIQQVEQTSEADSVKGKPVALDGLVNALNFLAIFMKKIGRAHV